MKLFHINDV